MRVREIVMKCLGSSSTIRFAATLSIAAMGCGACHHIPGIPGANGMVGPPLDNVAQRGILAGELANSPENMVRWIRDPQSVEPATAMPNLHIGEQSARDIVAYLYSLH